MSYSDNREARSSSKRSISENFQKPARTKRSRYVNKACNECKRRKLRCDGEEPCERCLSQASECVYAGTPSQSIPAWNEFRNLNTEIQSIRSNLDQVMKKVMLGNQSGVPQPEKVTDPCLTSELQHGAVINNSSIREEIFRTPSRDASPHRGPTSSGFAFQVVRERLEAIGLDRIEVEPLSRRDELELFSTSLLDNDNFKLILEKDPLLQMDSREVYRLIDVWANGIGRLFPVIDLEQLRTKFDVLHKSLSAQARMTKRKLLEVIGILSDGDTHILKLVLSNALTGESGGMNEKAKRLFDSSGGAPQSTLTKIPTLRNINALILLILLYYHLDDEMRGSRVIFLASRLCFEMGLHRTETFQRNLKDEKAKCAAAVTFWSVYILERRSSIGMGVPYIMQDVEIDASLPCPSEHPYLEAMIGLTKLSGEICRRTSTLRDRNIKFPAEEIDYQDFKISQWQKQLTPDLTSDFHELQLGSQGQLQLPTQPIMHLAIVLHIRTQQIRGLIYRPVLYSAARITENKAHAQTAVDIARDSVQFLVLVSRSTTLATDDPLFFRDFLMSHLAAILLAVSNGHADFSRQLCVEYYLAIDVLRDLRFRSRVIARIWDSIRMLEVIGPKLGLNRVSQVTLSRNFDNTSTNFVQVSSSQEAIDDVSSEHRPFDTAASTLPNVQQSGGDGAIDAGDFPFSAAMFPLQLRNELSMMDESLLLSALLQL